jgi:hypothetical protein
VPNSELGLAWVEIIVHRHRDTTRVAMLLERALSIAREQWTETSMNVAMDVSVDKNSTRKERSKTETGRAKKEAERQKALDGEKKRKRNVSGNKDKKLEKIAKNKKKSRDVTLHEFYFRLNLKKQKTAALSEEAPREYIVISDDDDEERYDDASQSDNQDLVQEEDNEGSE